MLLRRAAKAILPPRQSLAQAVVARHLNQLTVAQEHSCTVATRLFMSQLYSHIFSLPRNGRRLIATTVADETHEIGLRIVTDLFEAVGWDTQP